MKKLLVPSVITLLISTAVQAQNTVEFSGFGVIGLTTSSSDKYKYRNDISYDKGASEDDFDLLTNSNLGLQLNYMASDQLSATLQAVIKDRSRTTLDKYISQAFIKYQFSPQWETRIGRTPIDLFALSEYRDVNIAYPWAATPNEVYGIIPHRYLDGIDITHTSHLSGGNLRSRLFYGQSESEAAAIGILETIKLDKIRGISLDWSTLNWSIMAKHTLFEFDNTAESAQQVTDGIIAIADNANQLGASAVLGGLGAFIPELLPNGTLWSNPESLADEFDMTGKSGQYTSLSAHYNWEHFGVTAEVSQIESDSIIMPDIKAGFISATYHKERSTYYTTLAKIETDAEDFDSSGINSLLSDPNSPLGNAGIVGPVLAGQFAALQAGYASIAEGAEQTLNYYAAEQTTLSIGWRHDLKDNMALNIQLDHTRIEDAGGTLWVQERTMLEGESVNTLFVTLGFTF